MPPTDTFTLFVALPSELRLKIWSEALSERCVWAAVFDADGEARKPKGLIPGLSAMVHVGAAPYTAGLACRESRRLLEESYSKPLRVPELAAGGVYWVDLERTVVWLGQSEACAVYTVLAAFGKDVLSRIRHVAVLSINIKASAMKVFFPLYTLCGGLRTIIVQRGEDAKRFSRLSPELAAYYATLPDSGPGETSLAYLEERTEFSDTHVAYSFLEGTYGSSHPALYLVTSEFADRLEGRLSS
ncbi:hypothetical protein CMUS01_00644 [Colletotrichum musicola]|uniref:2EXR domain-containing protein n=1 Tax=Colletotrichum musicola TaxID=2175873 RepID=A0A8H6NY82_9PEZI|nr:hypothetical protein CMUS01_00644 [Colletotrichum musicola]